MSADGDKVEELEHANIESASPVNSGDSANVGDQVETEAKNAEADVTADEPDKGSSPAEAGNSSTGEATKDVENVKIEASDSKAGTPSESGDGDGKSKELVSADEGPSGAPVATITKSEGAAESKQEIQPEKTENSMDTEDTSQAEQADESAASKEQPYSTRGRSTGQDASSGGENWEKGARESLEEMGKAKDASPASLGVSFLESLGEEDRRTRTRFLPDVDGMHTLRKNEIKEDLALARSLLGSAGVSSAKKTKGKRADSMEVEEEEGGPPSDEMASEAARLGTSTIELPSRDIVVPSNAFVALSGAKTTSSDEDNQTGSSEGQTGGQDPFVVDSVTAFSPPRPPESMGAKKKHRMLRWERRPEDVEVDLNNYRKTVQRTRQELHNAEAEYNRLETIDAHLRWTFLDQLNSMNDEYVRLSEELGSVQQECVKVADLLTSRTRSRGAGKGSYVMKEVLSVLKAKGTENAESMETETVPPIPGPTCTPGVGGLAPSAFNDWNRQTTISPQLPASSWIIPGEKVKTPVGEGTVVEVTPPRVVPAETTDPEAQPSESEKNEESGKSPEKSSDNPTKKTKEGSESDAKNETEGAGEDSSSHNFLQPRVSVKLPFGIGHFGLGTVQPMDNPCVFSDSRLVERWQHMVSSALSVGGALDLEGMSSNFDGKSDENDGEVKTDDTVQMAVDQPTHSRGGRESGSASDEEEGKMPFAAGLLPTAIGRGTMIHKMSITDIEKAMHKALYSGKGVLGKTTNQGVTEDFRKWEDDEQEYILLQADILQLRNALVRQKRIRILNERTSAATSERYSRAEELVAEMRSDLKSLKHRLEEELKELGIDEANADQILSSFYMGQESPVDLGEVSPLKRSRQSVSHEEDVPRVGGGGRQAYHDDDRSVDDLSGDDLETHRAPKKMRPNQ